MKVILALLILSLTLATPTPDSQKLLQNIQKLQEDPCSSKAIQDHKAQSGKLFNEISQQKK